MQTNIFQFINDEMDNNPKVAIAYPVKNSHYQSDSIPQEVYNVKMHEECIVKFLETISFGDSEVEYCSLESTNMLVYWKSNIDIEMVDGNNWQYNIINGCLYKHIITNGMDYTRKNHMI